MSVCQSVVVVILKLPNSQIVIDSIFQLPGFLFCFNFYSVFILCLYTGGVLVVLFFVFVQKSFLLFKQNLCKFIEHEVIDLFCCCRSVGWLFAYCWLYIWLVELLLFSKLCLLLNNSKIIGLQ